ncbi:MAG: hypothetical protein NTX15_08010 [Candidatus Kapabacteria bacterium]|nr:hypothetical protein [Candidatus Kapabacteria bacterium]
MNISIALFIVATTACWSHPDSASSVASDTLIPKDDRHYVISSREVEDLNFNVSIGASLAILPQPLTEYPTPAPMLDIRWRLASVLGLQGYGRIASNLATSIVQAGALYARDIGPATLGVGYSVSFVYGNITYIDGFNTTQERWINQPMICSSWRFDRVTLSARLELEVITSINQKIEDQVVRSDANAITGGSLTLAIEQPFWHDTHVVLGVTFANSSNPYQAWFLYNTFQDRLFSSEFFVGFIL